jgi:hypothetical protein
MKIRDLVVPSFAVVVLLSIGCGPSKARKAALDEARDGTTAISVAAKSSYQREEIDGQVLGGGASIATVHKFCPSGDWDCLRITKPPTTCTYDYKSSAKDFTATATCDPDKDGKLLTVVVVGTVNASGDVDTKETVTGDK